jgi:hypothetical protein
MFLRVFERVSFIRNGVQRQHCVIRVFVREMAEHPAIPI